MSISDYDSDTSGTSVPSDYEENEQPITWDEDGIPSSTNAVDFEDNPVDIDNIPQEVLDHYRNIAEEEDKPFRMEIEKRKKLKPKTMTDVKEVNYQEIDVEKSEETLDKSIERFTNILKVGELEDVTEKVLNQVCQESSDDKVSSDDKASSDDLDKASSDDSLSDVSKRSSFKKKKKKVVAKPKKTVVPKKTKGKLTIKVLAYNALEELSKDSDRYLHTEEIFHSKEKEYWGIDKKLDEDKVKNKIKTIGNELSKLVRGANPTLERKKVGRKFGYRLLSK